MYLISHDNVCLFIINGYTYTCHSGNFHESFDQFFLTGYVSGRSLSPVSYDETYHYLSRGKSFPDEYMSDGSGSFLIVRSDTMLSHMIQYDTKYFFVFFGCDPAIRTGDYMMCSSCEKSGNNISIRVSPHRVL